MCFFPPFPLVSSQDMSNCYWTQTELFTSSVRELGFLKYTFCRITQTFACLLQNGNELWENSLVRFLALHGLESDGKTLQNAAHEVFLCIKNKMSHRSKPLKTDIIKLCGLVGKGKQSCICSEVSYQFLFYLHCIVQEIVLKMKNYARELCYFFVFTKNVLSELEIWSNQIVVSE